MASDMLGCLVKSNHNFTANADSPAVTGANRVVLAANPLRVYLAFWADGVGTYQIGPDVTAEMQLPFIVQGGGQPVEFHIDKHKALVQGQWRANAVAASGLNFLELLFTQ